VKRAIFTYIMLIVASIALVATWVPSKYLPVQALGIDLKTINQVSIDGAQSIEFYDIQGTNDTTLNAAMEKERVTLGGFAITSYSVSYIITIQNPDTPECKIFGWEVPYTVKVVMPRWTNPQDAPLSQVWYWRDYYYPMIARHEGWHVQTVLEGVERLNQVIADSNCANVVERADATIADILKRQQEYDVQTGNGSKDTE
jgi:predicted secreted Zn-dependent protease